MGYTVRFNFFDWMAIVLFFVALVGIALGCSRKASKDAKDFFLSGRSMPWWLIGVSMCAATTSTNSANMFTEFIRNSGLSENWKWWAFLLTGMLTVFVYSKLWVRSGAKSDIEFYELRYSGRAAAFLRGFRALYLGIVFNVITTGLVMLAAIKIGQVLFGIDQWTVIAVTAICSIIYSALGGFRGAIYTDFFLFVLIMIGSVVGMVYAISRPEVGGFAAMMHNPVVLKHISFLPHADNKDLFVAVFVIPIAIQWWNVWYPGSEPGGGGYIVQRMLSAKSENHCVAGSVFYQVVNYAIRPWPWYLTAFASLIVFPDLASLQKAFPHIAPSLVKGDLAYPAMLTFVPNGWLGVVVASMMGALFSTVAAHLSMGSNYIANDFWKRFVRPAAGERELILVGRVTVVVLMALSGLLAPVLSSAGAVFNLILQIGAGTGLIYLLRWFWMRINAWSEITAMAVSFVVAVFLQLIYPHLDLPPLLSWHRLLIVMAVTTIAWVGVTLATPPTDAQIEALVSYAQKGGRMVVTGDAGRYDSWNAQRRANTLLPRLKGLANVVVRASPDMIEGANLNWRYTVNPPKDGGAALMADLVKVGWRPPVQFEGLPPHTFVEYRRLASGAYVAHLVNYRPEEPVRGARLLLREGVSAVFEEPFAVKPVVIRLGANGSLPPFGMYAVVTLGKD